MSKTMRAVGKSFFPLKNQYAPHLPMPELRGFYLKSGGNNAASDLYINDQAEYPKLQPTGVIVKVTAFGLNRADTMQRVGQYPMQPWFPKTLGLEFAGTIAEVGSSQPEDPSHDFKVGDEVFGLTYGGAYAEYVAVSKRMIIRKPKEVSWEVAAGVCEVWFTALQSLYVVGEYTPEKVKSVLWHAGASSVSIAGIQLSRAANKGTPVHPASPNTPPAPLVFATARSDAKCSLIKSDLKATDAFNSSSTDWVSSLKEKSSGRGADLLIDFIGGSDMFEKNLEALAPDGRMVILGLMGGTHTPGPIDVSLFLRKRISVVGSTLRARDEKYQGHLRDLFEEYVLPQLISGEFDAKIETKISWKEVGKGHEMLEQNKTSGKVVCFVD